MNIKAVKVTCWNLSGLLAMGKLLLRAYSGGAIATHKQAPAAEGKYTLVAFF